MATRYSGLNHVTDGLTKAARVSPWAMQEAVEPTPGIGEPNYKPNMRTMDDMIMGKVMGDSPGGVRTAAGIAAPMAAYMLPGVRTAMPAYNTVADVANIFSRGATMKQRLGHAGNALVDGAFTGLGLISDVATVASGGALAAPTAALTGWLGGLRSAARGGMAAKTLRAGSKIRNFENTAMGRYLSGNTGWQQGMRQRGGVGVKPWYAPSSLGARAATSPWFHAIGGSAVSGAMSSPEPVKDPRLADPKKQMRSAPVPFGTGGYFTPNAAPTRYRGLSYMNPWDKEQDMPFSGTPTPQNTFRFDAPQTR